jgi:hypothetical protein
MRLTILLHQRCMDVKWTVWILLSQCSLDSKTGRLLGVAEPVAQSRSLILVRIERDSVVVLVPLEGVESGDKEGALPETVSRNTHLQSSLI